MRFHIDTAADKFKTAQPLNRRMKVTRDLRNLTDDQRIIELDAHSLI